MRPKFRLEIPKGTDYAEERNIMMDLKEMCFECVDWSHVSQDRNQLQASVKRVMSLRIPLNVEGFLTTFPGIIVLHGGKLLVGPCDVLVLTMKISA